MGFKVMLEYLDGDMALGRPQFTQVDALPPRDAEIVVHRTLYDVHKVKLAVHSNEEAQYTLVLAGHSING